MQEPETIERRTAPSTIESQLRTQRRTVDFDTFDIHMQQLLAMLGESQIQISPAYQRNFRWGSKRCSQFIESLMLGIPVPSLFMATNADNTWEVVDGVQRLSTIVKFCGPSELRRRLNVGERLILTDLEKLTDFVGLGFDDLPASIQLHFQTRPAKVVTLNDKSDSIVRYDLFERLNTGGVALSPQEIRDCVFRSPFADHLEEWARNADFKTVVRLTPLQQRDATAEECVLRFFAFRDQYLKFDHNVTSFLNRYMEAAAKHFNYTEGMKSFTRTFAELARAFPNGIRRHGRNGTTPLNLYEGVAVGAALALKRTERLNLTGVDNWMQSPELRAFTTGATNSLKSVRGRIEFCRDRFLGKPYVSSSAA